MTSLFRVIEMYSFVEAETSGIHYINAGIFHINITEVFLNLLKYSRGTLSSLIFLSNFVEKKS